MRRISSYQTKYTGHTAKRDMTYEFHLGVEIRS